MLFDQTLYVGIDPTAGVRPIHYMVLDRELRLVAAGEGSLQDVVAFVGGFESAVVAIDAPQSPNKGLMLEPEVRRRYNLRPGSKTWGQWKLCEYELRRRNIRLYNTPGRESDAPRWMRNGFTLYKKLARLGYRQYVQGEELPPKAMIEVHPHACFAVLLGHRPFLKDTLEGRLQRQLLLFLEGLDIPNPMKALEEITRHHLLSGNLPLDGLYDHDRLDALAAAYTSYLVGIKPEAVTQVGDRSEGMITLPAAEPKAFYP
jgi:predicted nuclease with RNAse H fold